jgi:hypothetical protein
MCDKELCDCDKECWREQIIEAMELRGETFSDIVSITLTDDELDEKFDSGFGSMEGKPFTAWTNNTVYFPLVYDGAEWVGSVSRNPDGKPTEHQGGG